MTCAFCDEKIGSRFQIRGIPKCSNCSFQSRETISNVIYLGHFNKWDDVYAIVEYESPMACLGCNSLIERGWVLCEDGGIGRELFRLVSRHQEVQNDSHHD